MLLLLSLNVECKLEGACTAATVSHIAHGARWAQVLGLIATPGM